MQFDSLFQREARVHHVGEHGDLAALPLPFQTSNLQWAYAIEWSRTAQTPTAPLLIAVTVRVLEGTIGVGILAQRGDEFVDRVMVGAGTHDESACLVCARPEDLGAIVVHNASPDGPSRAVVVGINVCALEDPEEAARPALSAPAPVAGWPRYYGSAGLTPVERLRATRFEHLQAAALLHWSDGLAFEVRPGDQLSRAVYVSGTYEPKTLCVLRALLRRGDTFIDVGANAGIVSLAAAQWVGRSGAVHAFEPSSREYLRLLDTISRNRLVQVTAYPVALGADRGRARLKVASSGQGGLNTLGKSFAYDETALDRTEDVDVRTLDEVAAEEQIGRSSAIKIDVEGMELHVLRGAREIIGRDRPALIVEVFARALEACGAGVDALQDLLLSSGYRLFTIRADGELESLETLRSIDEQNIVALTPERLAALRG
jgi:FkbM family methyltransferase